VEERAGLCACTTIPASSNTQAIRERCRMYDLVSKLNAKVCIPRIA
jgi:hypothetical protein